MAQAPDLHELELALLDRFANLGSPSTRSPEAQGAHAVTDEVAQQVFAAQMQSRIVDHTARWLRAQGVGYYTIGSAGHESNAWVAAALRPTDPALLHYRSGGFYCARAAQVGRDPVDDIIAGMLALADEPIAGGRHKVFGHHDLAIIPQTSTIASHLPRAVGVGLAIGRGSRLGLADQVAWPADALAVCSFGDASANHSTAQGAINSACYTASRGIALPLLFVCEDNGLGISTPTPDGWVASMFADRPGLLYGTADGDRPLDVYRVASELAAEVRRTRRPALLHLRTVRYMGHAGSDVEAAYRNPSAMRADYAADPIAATAEALVARGLTTPDQLVSIYHEMTEQIRAHASNAARTRAPLRTATDVMAPLAPRTPDQVRTVAATPATPEQRRAVFGTTLPEQAGPLTLAETINRALTDALAKHGDAMIFGEDVGAKGGVYGVTRGLQKRFGQHRVFDTILDEQAILGVALGAAVSGLLAIPEIQYLAYLHNAEDQLRGEAASLSFFSNGQYQNGMVVRIAGYAYQRGFGGHFHNDHSVAVLRDIPGLVIASPAHPADAAAMMRTCVAAATTDGTVSTFLEPIARYHTRDLIEPGGDGGDDGAASGDGAWLAPYTPPALWTNAHIPIGQGAVSRDGDDVLIITYANGRYLAEQAAVTLAAEHDINVRVFDMRWLQPMPIDQMVHHANDVGRVLVVDETRRSGGVSEGVITSLIDRGVTCPIARVAAPDSFVPLGDAANLVLIQPADIVASVCSLLA